MSQLSSNRSRLAGLSKELNRQWSETSDKWRDQKRRDFEETYMRTLLDSVQNAMSAMEELDQLLKKIHSDCES